MNKRILTACFALTFGTGLATGAYLAPEEVYSAPTINTSASNYETIVDVVDGDTFAISAQWSPYDLRWKVRIRGIDTPEKGARAKCDRERKMAEEATAYAERLAHETLGRIRLKNVDHDKYGGRIDADVILADGRSMGNELIKAGLAKPYNGGGPRPSWCY